MSEMSKTKQRTFATAFAERLYRRNREALLVVADEADVLIPQRATAETARLVGAWDDVAKRGRGRGLGMLVVTQRPQDVAKSVLDEMHTLLLHGTIGPRAVGAIKTWIADHDDAEGSRVKEVLQSLRSLRPGEGWLWAPQHEILQRTRVRRIDTFDSHATPEPGKARRVPKTLASIDLDAITEKIAATVERAEANDPKALQRRVADLEQALAERPTVEPEIEHVAVLDEEERYDLRQATTALGSLTAVLRTALGDVERLVARVEEVLGDHREIAPGVPIRRFAGKVQIRREDVEGPIHLQTPMPAPAGSPDSVRAYASADPARRNEVAARQEPLSGQGLRPVTGPLPKAQKAILTVLRVHGGQSIANVAILTGYAAGGGGFKNAVGALRSAGYITESKDPLFITNEGAEAVGPVPPLPRGDALREQWKGHTALGKAHGLILDALAESHPRPMDVESLAAATGYAASGGGFKNALGRLRSLGLIEGKGALIINPSLVD